MSRALPRPIALALVLVLIATGCADQPTTPASVLFVTIDTLRPDHLGAYGHPDARTPRLDRLARRGALFEEVRVPYPLTLPSHSTIFTGRRPYRHGARRNDSFDLDPDLPSLPQAFGAAGRATAAVVSTFVLNANFGLSAWFDEYMDLEGNRPDGGHNERRAPETTRLVRDWLSDHADAPFFFWAHYFDPHDDYEPPAPWRAVFGGSERELYDGEIAFTDRELGRVLRDVEGRSDLLIVITSDHGEAFGEHGEVGHGYFLYETTLRVPLMIAWADAKGGDRIHAAPTRSLDLFPTVARLGGVAAPEQLPGRFLDPFGDGPSGDAPLYVETFEPTVGYGATDLRGVVDDGWKWIEAPLPELYELATDPHELDNREGTAEPEEEELREQLAAYLADARISEDQRGESEEVDEETRDRLMALGYLTSGPDEEGDGTWSRRDPKEIVHLIPTMFEGIRLCRLGELDEGVALLKQVLEEDPLNGKALHWVAEARLRAEDPEGALDVYRNALQHDPEDVDLLNRYGVMAMRSGHPDEAVSTLEAAVALDPDSIAGWLNLASAYMGKRQPNRARDAVRRALEVDPTNPMARSIAQRLQMGPPPPDQSR